MKHISHALRIGIDKRLFIFLVATIIGVALGTGNYWIVVGLLVLLGFQFLIAIPELALAIIFNGTIAYFYAVYKLGFEPKSIVTGVFYGFLGAWYLVGGLLPVLRKRARIRLCRIDLVFLVLMFVIFVSYFAFSRHNENALKKLIYAPALVVMPYCGVRLLSSGLRIGRFFQYIVALSVMLMAVSFYELILNPIYSEYGRFSMYMFQNRGDNPILFGVTVGNLLIILMVLVFERDRIDYRYLLLIGPSAWLLIRSGARGPLLSLFASTVFYLLVVLPSSTTRKVHKIIGILVCVLVFVFVVQHFVVVPESTFSYYKYTFSYDSLHEPVSSVNQRLDMWRVAFDELVDNPIFGVGLGNSVSGSGFPHNILLEVGAELGVIGIFLVLYLVYATLMRAIVFLRRGESPDAKMLMKVSVILFVYSLAEAMVSGYITNQTQLFMMIGIIVGLSKVRDEDICLRGFTRG